MNADNITTFLRKYVKTRFLGMDLLRMEQSKACLNAAGWEELFKVAKTVVVGQEVRLRKKQRTIKMSADPNARYGCGWYAQVMIEGTGVAGMLKS